MHTVTIYTTPSCVFCRMSKDFFKANGIEYTELNVATDVEARNAMIQKSGQLGVPVTDIDGKLTIGFDKARFSELLGIR